MDIPDRLTCIILSAGNSGRMGMHKALLPFGDENLTFLEKISLTYQQSGVNQIIVVVNQALSGLLSTSNIILPEKLEIVVNPYPEKGRFSSLQTGLRCARAGSHVFIQNADNPFTEKDLLLKMIENRSKAGVIIPVFSGKDGHPVLINSFVCESILNCSNPATRLDYFLRKFSAYKVESDNHTILVNINTPGEYRKELGGGLTGTDLLSK